MNRKTLAVLCFLTLATLLIHSQTIGGDTSHSSKTWTWTAQSADLSSTTLFTPTADSDFLVTLYVSDTLNGDVGGQICPSLTWTDENGGQSFRSCSVINSSGVALPATSALPIHVSANTGVSVSVAYQVPPGSPVATYSLVVSKTKLNP